MELHNGDYRPLFDDSFDVEDYDAVREYIDQGGRKSRGPLNDDIKKGIQEACEEARHERGIVSVAVLVFFVVFFVSVPKPKFSKKARTRSHVMSNGNSNRLARRKSVELSEVEAAKAVACQIHAEACPSVKGREPNCLRRSI
mgnify:CR=1 FL=1